MVVSIPTQIFFMQKLFRLSFWFWTMYIARCQKSRNFFLLFLFLLSVSCLLLSLSPPAQRPSAPVDGVRWRAGADAHLPPTPTHAVCSVPDRVRTARPGADARRTLSCERAAGGARYAPNAPHARADAAPTRADADGRSVTPALTQRPCASADGARRRRALR